MASDSIRTFILKAIERSKIAEPYPDGFLEKQPDDMFPVAGDSGPLDQRRVTATMAKKVLDKYFAEHPDDSIENYINEDRHTDFKTA